MRKKWGYVCPIFWQIQIGWELIPKKYSWDFLCWLEGWEFNQINNVQESQHWHVVWIQEWTSNRSVLGYVQVSIPDPQSISIKNVLRNLIWVNYNNSLTWNKAMKGDDFPNPFTIIYGFRSFREVVIKFTQIYYPFIKIYHVYGLTWLCIWTM